MARIFSADPSEDFTRVSIPIRKFEKQADGSVLVFGKATDGGLDRDLQIIDPDFAKKSLQAWFATGANIRVMHSPSLYPAGRGVELMSQEDGEWLTAKIVEPTAIKLVEEGVLQAYSVGIARPRIIRDQVAKGGRVVDGETVEVSLVDRPANPSCGLMLAKMAGGAEPTVEFTNELLGDLQNNRDERGPSFVEQLPEDVTKSAEPDVTGQEKPDVEKGGGKDCSDCGKPYHFDSEVTHCEKCGSKLPKGKKVTKAAKDDESKEDESKEDESKEDDPDDEAEEKKIEKADAADLAVDQGLDHLKDALRQVLSSQAQDPDRTTHDADRKVDAALERTGKDIDSAVAAQREDERTEPALTKSVDHVDLTGEPPTLTPADGMPYGLRRLHDATCAAYGWVAVKEAHPALQKIGFGELIGSASNLLNASLGRALAEDAGTGQAADQVAGLAKAYQAATVLGVPDEQALAAARAHLHKSFMGDNPEASAHLTPLNTGAGGHQPNAKQFVRPYVSAGHANQTASAGQRPRVPSAKPVSAEQFGRGLLTDGHEADSPHNTGSMRPATPTRSRPQASPGRAPGEKGIDAELTKNDPMNVAGSMAAMHDHIADLYPHVCPMDDRYATRQSDINHQDLAQTSTLDTNPAGGPKQTSATPDLIKSADPALLKAAVAELVDEQVESRLAMQAERYETELVKMRTQLDELAAQPDPRQAPFRGMAGIEQILPELTKRAQEPPAGATAEKVSRLAAWLDSPDPQQREAARASLLKQLR